MNKQSYTDRGLPDETEPQLHRLIAVADSRVLSGRDIPDACVAAETGGATSIQLRMKTAPASDFLRTVVAVLERVSIPVFVNDRVDIAVLAGAAGVHLGADDISVSGARQIRGAGGLWFGTSVGSVAEADAAADQDVAYWGCGPVYPTANKGDAGAPIGRGGIRRLVELANEKPVVGIGGIDATNCRTVFEAGASGIAAIGSIFGNDNIETATRALRKAIDEYLD